MRHNRLNIDEKFLIFLLSLLRYFYLCFGLQKKRWKQDLVGFKNGKYISSLNYFIKIEAEISGGLENL